MTKHLGLTSENGDGTTRDDSLEALDLELTQLRADAGLDGPSGGARPTHRAGRELDDLLLLARVTVASARARRETRGAFVRADGTRERAEDTLAVLSEGGRIELLDAVRYASAGDRYERAASIDADGLADDALSPRDDEVAP